MADELTFSADGFAHGELAALARELAEAGVDKSSRSLRYYAHAARLIDTAAPIVRKALRERSSVTALGRLGEAGFTAAEAAAEVAGGCKLTVARAEALVAVRHADQRAAAGEPEPCIDYDAKARTAASAIIDLLAAERDGTELDLDAGTLALLHTAGNALRHVAAEDDPPRRPARSDDPSDWTDEDWQRFDKLTAKAGHQLMRAMRYRDAGIYSPGVGVSLLFQIVRPNIDWDAELADLTGGDPR